MLKEAWGVFSYLPWLWVNICIRGGIFLHSAFDFLKEQMVLFPNYQLVRGWGSGGGGGGKQALEAARAPRSCALLPLFLSL